MKSSASLLDADVVERVASPRRPMCHLLFEMTGKFIFYTDVFTASLAFPSVAYEGYKEEEEFSAEPSDVASGLIVSTVSPVTCH